MERIETGVIGNMLFKLGLWLLAAAVPERCADFGPSQMHRAEMQMHSAAEQVSTPVPTPIAAPTAVPESLQAQTPEVNHRAAPKRTLASSLRSLHARGSAWMRLITLKTSFDCPRSTGIPASRDHSMRHVIAQEHRRLALSAASAGFGLVPYSWMLT